MPFTGPLEDRELIRELIDTYCEGVAQRDAAVWGSTWAEDSIWSLPHLNIDVTGRAAIVEAWKAGMALFPFVQMMSQCGSIEVSGDTAVVRCYTDEVAITQEGKEIRPRGQYDDVCVKRDGQWLFKQRTFKVLHGE